MPHPHDDSPLQAPNSKLPAPSSPFQTPSSTLPSTTAIVLVDHGSRRQESNRLLVDVARQLREQSGYAIVEPAHMELVEPSIATAIRRAVEQGATLVVVHPYFLGPGSHWHEDIPQLVAQAANCYRGLKYLVTAPLGPHPLLVTLVQQRIEQCVAHARDQLAACPLCYQSDYCQIRTADSDQANNLLPS